MKKINELLINSIDILGIIYNCALIEESVKIKEQYVALVKVVNELYQIYLGDNQSVDMTILVLIEKLYDAIEKGDYIRIIDLTKYMMEPRLQRLESLGESIATK